jgi:hypothetical protein
MHWLIEQHRTAIVELCLPHRVRRLERCSARQPAAWTSTHGVPTPIFWLSSTRRMVAPTLKAFFALRDGLAAVLGRPVDLVAADSLTDPFVNAEVDRTRVPIYAP